MIVGPIRRADVPALCDRLRLLVAAAPVDVVVCDVAAVDADVVGVEALARVQLTARRLGCRIRLRRASRELAGLIAFCGLGDLLPTDRGRLGGQPWREAEQREQPLGVEEAVEGGDPPV
jgi:ABC-type transporter Mla MlaB component